MIALGVKLTRQKDELDLIRKEPLPLTEFRPKNFDADYQRKFDEQVTDSEESDSSDEGRDRCKPAVDADDEWNAVDEDRQTKRTNKRKEEKQAHWLKK